MTGVAGDVAGKVAVTTTISAAASGRLTEHSHLLGLNTQIQAENTNPVCHQVNHGNHSNHIQLKYCLRALSTA